MVRPHYGLPRFKNNAFVAVKDGTVVASNRWGKHRQFRLSNGPDSPKKAGWCTNHGQRFWWLEDAAGRVLLLVDLGGWRGSEFTDVEKATDALSQGVSDQVPPLRSDVFKVRDLPVLQWAFACVGIGIAAMSLRWLHIVPEVAVIAVALPALLVTLWLMALLWIARPSDEEKAHAAYILRHVDELADAARAGIDPEEYMASHPEPAPDGVPKRQRDQPDASAEQVDGS